MLSDTNKRSIKLPQPIVFLTRLLPETIMTQLHQHFDLRCAGLDRPLTKEEIKEGIHEADGVISMLSDQIDQSILAGVPQLKVIANYAVGYNNIDFVAAKALGIAVTNTPGVLTETTADLTWALLMAVARRIPEGDQLLQIKKWSGWSPTELLGNDIYGKNLGIVGMGRIAQAVVRRARGFAMSINYYSRTRQPEIEEMFGIRYLPFQKLLSESDYLSLHLPLNQDSKHLIDQTAFQRMKPNTILINTSRGPIVDEKALVQALKEKQISGAGLDVFEEEPVISPELLKMNNVITLPHIGSASGETRIAMGMMVIDNLLTVFKNETPPNMVN